MKITRISLLLALTVCLGLTACNEVVTDPPEPAESTQNNDDPEVGNADLVFAEQFIGTYEGHCCSHITDDEGTVNHGTYDATNVVTLSEENNSDLLIDGMLFTHISGTDMENEDILYRSNEGYGYEVTFRKGATILKKNTSFSTPTETGYINCETYR